MKTKNKTRAKQGGIRGGVRVANIKPISQPRVGPEPHGTVGFAKGAPILMPVELGQPGEAVENTPEMQRVIVVKIAERL